MTAFRDRLARPTARSYDREAFVRDGWAGDVAGDRSLALSDARCIARFLVRNGAQRVAGIGSAFDPQRLFTHRSDIDLVVEGIDPVTFYSGRPGPPP